MSDRAAASHRTRTNLDTRFDSKRQSTVPNLTADLLGVPSGWVHGFYACQLTAARQIPPEDQKVNFNPSWIWRLLPDPTTGLPAAISGVVHPQPNVVPLEGSLPPP
jgi:hypothetical protein